VLVTVVTVWPTTSPAFVPVSVTVVTFGTGRLPPLVPDVIGATGLDPAEPPLAGRVDPLPPLRLGVVAGGVEEAEIGAEVVAVPDEVLEPPDVPSFTGVTVVLVTEPLERCLAAGCELVAAGDRGAGAEERGVVAVRCAAAAGVL
jgi:hypothetical protein